MNATITKIQIDIDGVKLELTYEQAKAMHAKLSEIFKRPAELIYVPVPSPAPIAVPSWTYTPPPYEGPWCTGKIW